MAKRVKKESVSLNSFTENHVKELPEIRTKELPVIHKQTASEGIIHINPDKLPLEPEANKGKIKADPPSASKIMHMLNSEGVSRGKICKVLAQGLNAMKVVVIDDGEAIETIDYETRRKYVETILEVLGEKKAPVDNSTHFHFTNILQQIRAYERGEKGAVELANAAVEGVIGGGDG